MGNALFIVWRESLEAMLVVGVLYAWLARNAPERLRALWAGTAGGLALAGGLAYAIVSVQDELSGEAVEWFQTGALLLAAVLIAQMVLWMQKHGRHMKKSIEAEVAAASEKAGGLGIALVAALAIGREGAETVIFLYGVGLEQGSALTTLGGAAIGLALAGLTAWAVSRGLRGLTYATFFRVTSLLLLMFGASLLVAGIDRLVGGGLLPALVDPLWDTSALLDDTSGLGKLLYAVLGYRAMPSLSLVLAYAAYWAVVFLVGRIGSAPAKPAMPMPARENGRG